MMPTVLYSCKSWRPNLVKDQRISETSTVDNSREYDMTQNIFRNGQGILLISITNTNVWRICPTLFSLRLKMSFPIPKFRLYTEQDLVIRVEYHVTTWVWRSLSREQRDLVRPKSLFFYCVLFFCKSVVSIKKKRRGTGWFSQVREGKKVVVK